MRSDRAFSGLFLILLGTVLLLNQLGHLPFGIPEFVFSWPTILIITGIFVFITPGKDRVRRSNRLSGVFLIVLGILFLIAKINPAFAPLKLWPVFIIISGLFILLKRKQLRSLKVNPATKDLDEILIFSAVEKKITTPQFKGGKAICIFGGADIDLLDSELAPGVNVMEVITIFGGTEFYVPNTWKVKVEVAGLFGAFSDKRRDVSPETQNNDAELIIKGVSIFGGGDLKSFSRKRRFAKI